MSDWSHSICATCWFTKHPSRVPCGVLAPGVETCCFCGVEHSSGIYVRQDPSALDCTHPPEVNDNE